MSKTSAEAAISAVARDRLGRYLGGAGIVGVLVLVGAVLVPGGHFWTAILASSVLVGSAVATVVLMRSRDNPTLAQVVATAKAESRARPSAGRPSSEAGLRARGDLMP
jgi:hypothetical protein